MTLSLTKNYKLHEQVFDFVGLKTLEFEDYAVGSNFFLHIDYFSFGESSEPTYVDLPGAIQLQ